MVEVALTTSAKWTYTPSGHSAPCSQCPFPGLCSTEALTKGAGAPIGVRRQHTREEKKSNWLTRNRV